MSRAASVATIVSKGTLPSASRTTTTVVGLVHVHAHILVQLHQTLLCEFNASTLNGCRDSSLDNCQQRGVLSHSVIPRNRRLEHALSKKIHLYGIPTTRPLSCDS